MSSKTSQRDQKDDAQPFANKTSNLAQISTPNVTKDQLLSNEIVPDGPIWKGILSSFALEVNYRELWRTRVSKDEDPELEMFEGIKVFHYAWGVQLCTSFYLQVPPVRNQWELLDYFHDEVFAMTTSAHIGFDIFFLILAFFDFYHFEQISQKEGGFGLKAAIRCIYRRFFRIAPVYYIIFFAGWLIGPFLFSGPAWYVYSTIYHDCETYWWANVLFIGNLVPSFQIPTEGCFYWSAFIQGYMQMYLFFPLLFVLYKKLPALFVVASVLLCLMSTTTLFYFAYWREFTVGILSLENYWLWDEIFRRPWNKF